MKWRDWIERWGLQNLKINAHFLEMEFAPDDPDRAAAWDLYVELLTRVSTQPLPDGAGDEATALASVHTLFALTRQTLKTHGRRCDSFAKIAIVVLNQVVRPFTARWHQEKLAGAFDDPASCAEFRRELTVLQTKLHRYTKMLADMAQVEDLTNLEAAP